MNSPKRQFVALLVCLVLLAPTAANAGVGNIIILLRTITSTLQNTVGQALNGINAVSATVRDLRQQIVWPLNLINQTRSFIGQTRAQFTTVAGEIHSVSTNSATLKNPLQLESLLRSTQASTLGQVGGAYTQVYQPLPPPTDASQSDRSLMDMDDAMAQDALKTAVATDNASEQILTTADGLEQAAISSAPGAAPLLTAQAQTANLESQALLQKMLAAELRQEAARLAHANALRKRSAQATQDLRDHLQQILSRH
jgi:hypothetical protein